MLDEIKNYLSYDPLTGIFTRLKIHSNKGSHTRLIGKPTGNKSSNGYIQICVKRKNYPAHRLAWFFVHGVYPDTYLDHINGIKDDNRIENLRLSDPSSNMKNRRKNNNNSSGANGVYSTESGKWRARIKINGELQNLGTFDTFEEALAARRYADTKYGFDAQHGVRE